MKRKCNEKNYAAFALYFCYANGMKFNRMGGRFFMKENKTLELKSVITNRFLKTVSAYANFGTGKILFGVDDDGNKIGIKNPKEVCLDIENKINDAIEPRPHFSIEILPEGPLVELTVEEGADKLYLYKGKAYRRSDTATVPVEQIELKRLILKGIHTNFEEHPYRGPDELTFHILEERLRSQLKIKNFDKDTLRTLGLLNVDKQYNNAGALLSDHNDFPGVDIVRFGSTINEIRERRKIDGKSILLLYDEGMQLFERYYCYEIIEGDFREKKELIPKEAFREAFANALVHRIWDLGAPIKISMFPKSIEIVSPGGLPHGISKDEYLMGALSQLRNPIIGNLFYRLKIIEMFGTGIRRIRYLYEASPVKPEFQVYENSISIVLPVLVDDVPMTADEKKVYGALQRGGIVTSKELSESLAMTKSKVLRLLQALYKRKLVKIEGNGRSTKYCLPE